MIRAAAGLFRRRGYDGTGLNEILERGGAPRGSLYFHFPGGKQELAAAAIVEAGATIGAGIERLLDSTDDVGEAVASVVELIAADLERSGYRGGCPVAAVTLDAASSSSERVRAACSEAFDHWQGLLEARLVGAGWARPEARQEATLVLAAIEGAQTLARARRDPEPLRAVARRLRAELSGAG